MDLIEEKVRKIISENGDLNIDLETVDLETDLTQFGLNSFGFTKILIFIEEEFKIHIDEYIIKDFDSIVSIKNFIELIKNA
ncbi:phosphopantetheine-binding protein [Treponema bryantii]|uniref:phosphopantetheine-binding protein n=1 Tax=Treponema bryantii TaxID=163 RepID=UPI002B2EA134|nr:hypothetical protein TRBR_26960 [Treponema bryantii]